MPMKVDSITLPAAWASYLVNGDDSGLSERERDQADSRLARVLEPGQYIVGTVYDDPWFSWDFDLYGGDCRGGQINRYITHQQVTA